jgi:hypothetical protein
LKLDKMLPPPGGYAVVRLGYPHSVRIRRYSVYNGEPMPTSIEVYNHRTNRVVSEWDELDELATKCVLLELASKYDTLTQRALRRVARAMGGIGRVLTDIGGAIAGFTRYTFKVRE